MHRLFAAARAACGLMLVALAPAAASAQNWNDPRTRELVERATARRAQQLADTGLKDFKAVAHGYVTFLAQVGEGLAEPPKVVKADELVNEVYWLAPNLSKQLILGRRDTLLLPTDIAYHRDHLGIVQNNFPAIIRLGDGDEVRDVAHPLSAAGLAMYDFAISPDSLTMQLPGRSIHVLEVKVRPRDDRQPAIIGALYIDRDDAQVVRMAFNFTRSAFKDDALDDLFVVIENSLVQGRFWLPSRQEIEIRRGGTWLDYPVRGIIRGRWQIGDYVVNTGLSPAFFNGPEIVLAIRGDSAAFKFSGRILDSLPPDVRAVTNADIRQVQQEARSLVRAQALRRTQKVSLAATGISDFVQFNRAEGLAVGGGIASRFGGGFGLRATGRYGIDDRTAKGGVSLDWQSPAWGVRLFGQSDFRQAGDIQERSRVMNSLAAQEFGGDATDPYRAQGGGLGLDARDVMGFRLRLDASLERQRALAIRAVPALGQFDPLVPATPLRALRFALGAERPTSLSFFGTELRISGELRVSRLTTDDAATPVPTTTLGRGFAAISLERPFESGRLAMYAAGGAVGADRAVPPQEWLYFGGPLSAPGYGFHELAARAGVTTRVEWRTQVPAPSFSLGRFGRIPGQATLAPFAQATLARPALRSDVAHPTGVYPAVGVALQPLFDMVRFQVARGLRNGRWTFNADVSRDFWGVL
jgi:hypothetical protein